jgi:hypothetical protein
MAPKSDPQRPCREPLFDINPLTGISIEVFYSDRRLETFGRCGAGWFWCSRRRGFPSEGPAWGPFATSYSAYRDAMTAPGADLTVMHSAYSALSSVSGLSSDP